MSLYLSGPGSRIPNVSAAHRVANTQGCYTTSLKILQRPVIKRPCPVIQNGNRSQVAYFSPGSTILRQMSHVILYADGAWYRHTQCEYQIWPYHHMLRLYRTCLSVRVGRYLAVCCEVQRIHVRPWPDSTACHVGTGQRITSA
eukprot:700223-Rhodomonas_salina.2